MSCWAKLEVCSAPPPTHLELEREPRSSTALNGTPKRILEHLLPSHWQSLDEGVGDQNLGVRGSQGGKSIKRKSKKIPW